MPMTGASLGGGERDETSMKRPSVAIDGSQTFWNFCYFAISVW